MEIIFTILRIITALTSLSSLILLSLVVFVRYAESTVKEGAKVLGYVAQLFATAFTEGTAPKTELWHIGIWQIMIGAVSVAMFASVFAPQSRWFLHSVAALTAIVMIGYSRMIFTGASMEIVCLPFLIVWFGYYAMCLFWRGNVTSQ